MSSSPLVGYQSRAAAALNATEIGGGKDESEHGRVHVRILQEDAITTDTLGPLAKQESSSLTAQQPGVFTCRKN